MLALVERAVHRISTSPRLDRMTEPAARVVRRRLDGTTADRVLRGEWLGHATHPMLVDLPIGFWTSSFTLDLLGRAHRPSSQLLLDLGTLSALPAMAAGVRDWAAAGDRAEVRRVGAVHAAANTAAFALYLWSSVERRRGRWWRGVSIGLLGATAATVGGHLGGHLVLRMDAKGEEA